jgi:hypothetical protein
MNIPVLTKLLSKFDNLMKLTDVHDKQLRRQTRESRGGIYVSHSLKLGAMITYRGTLAITYMYLLFSLHNNIILPCGSLNILDRSIYQCN